MKLGKLVNSGPEKFGIPDVVVNLTAALRNSTDVQVRSGTKLSDRFETASAVCRVPVRTFSCICDGLYKEHGIVSMENIL